MGANSSKESSSRSASLQSIHLKKTQEQVDFGSVFPNGLYSTAPQDFDARVLRQLILARKLAPFYKGLADAPEVVAAIPSPTHLATSTASATCSATAITAPAADHQLHRLQASASLTTLPLNSSSPLGRPRSASNRSDKMSRSKEKELAAERVKQLEATLYNDAVECPICFLYYPPNINYSRCCDQPICTECFIQIHRPTDDPSHAATCPYCLQDNYGAIYYPPAWSEKPSTTKNRLRSLSSSSSLSTNSSMSNLPSPTTPTSSGVRHTTSGSGQTNTPRRKSISHTHPDVVLIDHIRPHWNKPSPSATRSSRRNSLTSSGRPFLRAVTRPGRSASSAASTEYHNYLATVRDMSMDLEEYMVLQAIQESLQLHEEQERRRQEDDQAPNAENDDVEDDDDDDQPLERHAAARNDHAAAGPTVTTIQEEEIDDEEQQPSTSTASSDTSSASSIDDHTNSDKKSDTHAPNPVAQSNLVV